jgi:hypothetical protein
MPHFPRATQARQDHRRKRIEAMANAAGFSCAIRHAAFKTQRRVAFAATSRIISSTRGPGLLSDPSTDRMGIVTFALRFGHRDRRASPD